MPVWQRETRLPRVVESCTLLARDVVAAVALRAKSSFVNIIARVAGIARTTTEARMVGPIVTVGAGQTTVTQRQRKSRHLKVIEVDGRP